MAINWGYDASTSDAETKDAESAAAGEWMSWKDGENLIRVVPGEKGGKTFEVVQEHTFTPPGAAFPVRFVCPGPGCTACARAAQLEQGGNPADTEAARELSARGRVYFRCIDRNDEDRGVLKAAVTLKLFGKMQELRNNKRRGGDFVHPESGYDVCIVKHPPGSKQNSTKFPSYEVFKDKECRLGTDEQQKFWCETAPALKSLPPFRNVAEVEKLLTGRSSEREVRGELESGSRGRSIQQDAERDDERKFLE